MARSLDGIHVDRGGEGSPRALASPTEGRRYEEARLGGIAVGVIGTGFAASCHVEALRRLPEIGAVAVAGRTAERARAAARRFGAERSFGDYRALLEDDAVAAVHVCTPNDLHAEMASAALAAGKHVVCEKPLGLDARETSELVRVSESEKVVTAVCFNYRHYPLVRQAKELLAAGELGRAFLVHGGYLQDWLLHEDDWNWRLESSRAGGARAVGDIGSHWIDNVEYVIGDRVTRVSASLGRLHQHRRRPTGEVETFARGGTRGERVSVDTEDFATVMVEFGGGARGSLVISQVSAGRKNRLYWEIDAPAGALSWDQEEPNRLWLGRRDEANRELVRDPSLLLPPAAALAHLPGGHQEGWPEGLKNLLADFYAAVAARAPGEDYASSFATFEDAHHVTQVVGAIVASDRAGAWTEVGAAREVPA
jgi:predicted dehydrogenase